MRGYGRLTEKLILREAIVTRAVRHFSRIHRGQHRWPSQVACYNVRPSSCPRHGRPSPVGFINVPKPPDAFLTGPSGPIALQWEGDQPMHATADPSPRPSHFHTIGEST